MGGRNHRDREAVITYLETLGFIGPLVLMGLVGLQVLIPSLPTEPPIIAGAYAYGLTSGFLMSWVVSVAVSQAVFCLARYAGRPLVERFVPAKHLDKWTGAAGEKSTMFFLLAFVIPPVPSDILIYVAGLSAIEGRRFFVANFFGRMPMIVLLTIGWRLRPCHYTGHDRLAHHDWRPHAGGLAVLYAGTPGRRGEHSPVRGRW